MDFQKQWYEDEEVKKLLEQIEKVMKNFNLDKMNFESNSEINKYIHHMFEKPKEYKIITGYATMFHLEFDEGRIKIDL